MIRTIMKIADKLSAFEGSIYIRGAGFQGRLLKKDLEDFGIRLTAFIDNDYQELESIDGLPVVSPDSVYKSFTQGNKIFIALSFENSATYFRVRDELECAGMKEWDEFADLGIDCDKRMTFGANDMPMLYADRKRQIETKSKVFNDKLVSEVLPDWHREARYEDLMYISAIDLRITTYCTLKCKNCSHLLPHMSKYRHFDVEKIITDVNKLLKNVHIGYMAIMGGEALAHPEVDKLLVGLSKLENLKHLDCLYVLTNGTILPNDEIFQILKSIKSCNTQIWISDYGSLSHQKEKIQETCIRHKIPCITLHNNEWMDSGGWITNRMYSDNEQRQLFSACDSAVNCAMLSDGKLYLCPRINILEESGEIAFDEKASLDIRNTGNLTEKLKDYLYNTKWFDACNYCDGMLKYGRKVFRAEQL